MKVKSNKSSVTAPAQEDDENAEIEAVKPKKRAKIQNGHALINPAKNVTKKERPELLKMEDTSIFKHFKSLTSDEDEKRIEAVLQLLQHLTKTKEVEKRQKEIDYTIKRLVRGCGASTNSSRAGFFTGLTTFLQTFDENEVPLQQVFDTMQKELHMGGTISNKEDADAVVGKILVCGAVLHSKRDVPSNSEHLEKLASVLLQCTCYRTYHCSLGYSFLVELVQTLNIEHFEAVVWPLLREELIKPWPKQTLQAIHCLLITQERFPKIINNKFMKSHFGGAELLNPESYAHLYKMFWQHGKPDVLLHPGFQLFGVHIAKCAKLGDFWTEVVDPGLQSPTKLLELGTLKLISAIFEHLDLQKTNILTLLSDNFMKMFVGGLKTLKQKKDDTLKVLYSHFLEALVTCCTKLSGDLEKVAVIRRLILPPGAFNIEKYTNTRIIHQIINTLSTRGVQELYDLYKSIFVATLPKNVENATEHWLHFERLNAGYMLQHLLNHKAVQQDRKWGTHELQFLLRAGVFHTNDDLQICKKEAAGTFSKDFSEQCKKMFYTSLQSKLHDLQQEKELLLQLVQHCNEQMELKQVGKYMRLKNFDEPMRKTWQQMYAAVCVDTGAKPKRKTEKNTKTSTGENDKLQLVFHILLLNMGLHLFREPEMAVPAIEDLLKCMQRTTEQRQNKNSAKCEVKKDEEEELEWIEVLVDLFLHLLSQNASALRNIVNALFPHFCNNLNLNAVHQILAMLDMKNGNNPLSTKDEDEDEDNEEEQELESEVEAEAEEEFKEKSNFKSKNSKADNDETESDEDDEEEDDNANDDEDEDEEDEDDDEEEVTATDKLRNALSQALIDSGAANNDDDDMASVDLNDMTEEEGHKLDEALANVFKALKKPSNSPNQNKKSKSHRVKTTTVMHFRIRVLDLIEIYLQEKPSLLMSIEIMLALYDMLTFCADEELKPLQSKVEKVLTKLTTTKSFGTDAELQEQHLVDFIRLIVEKKASPAAFEITNRLRNKCVIFLISCCDKVTSVSGAKAPNSGQQVLKLCQEYMQDFIKTRNPLVNITLLSEILKLHWPAVWDLGVALAKQGLSLQTRTFRRIQIYELLAVLYKNWELQKLEKVLAKKYLKAIEKALNILIDALSADKTKKQSPKEFQMLLELLLLIHKLTAHLEIDNSLCTPAVHEAVQQIRRQLRLESATQVYQRYCATYKLSFIHNKELAQPADDQEPQENGHDASSIADRDSDSEARVNKSSSTDAKTQKQPLKRKKEKLDARKAKKQKKMQRLEQASKGLLNNGIGLDRATADTLESAEE